MSLLSLPTGKHHYLGIYGMPDQQIRDGPIISYTTSPASPSGYQPGNEQSTVGAAAAPAQKQCSVRVWHRPLGSRERIASETSLWHCVPTRRNAWVWNQEIQAELAPLMITPSHLLGSSVESCPYDSGLCRMRSPCSQKGHALTRGHGRGLIEPGYSCPLSTLGSLLPGTASKRNHHLVRSNQPRTA